MVAFTPETALAWRRCWYAGNPTFGHAQRQRLSGNRDLFLMVFRSARPKPIRPSPKPWRPPRSSYSTCPSGWKVSIDQKPRQPL